MIIISLIQLSGHAMKTLEQLPCITVTYSNGKYKASHKRDNERTLRKVTPTDFGMDSFDNARIAAKNLILSWEFGNAELVMAGFDADKWFFMCKFF